MKTYYELVDRAIQTLRELPLGTRVVVRYRIDRGEAPPTAFGGSRADPAGQMEPDAQWRSAAVDQGPRLTDVLGFLTELDSGTCTIRTKSGDVVVVLASVQAAKSVPPAPERRHRPSPGG